MLKKEKNTISTARTGRMVMLMRKPVSSNMVVDLLELVKVSVVDRVMVGILTKVAFLISSLLYLVVPVAHKAAAVPVLVEEM